MISSFDCRLFRCPCISSVTSQARRQADLLFWCSTNAALLPAWPLITFPRTADSDGPNFLIPHVRIQGRWRCLSSSPGGAARGWNWRRQLFNNILVGCWDPTHHPNWPRNAWTNPCLTPFLQVLSYWKPRNEGGIVKIRIQFAALMFRPLRMVYQWD